MDGFITFDLIIVAITLLLGLKGLMNGFFRELFGLIGVVGGIYFASRYGTDIGDFINQNFFKFQNQAAISITGFVVGLGFFWSFAILVGKFFTTIFSVSGLGSINKVLGFAIGSGKIFLIFSIIAYAISNVEIIQKNSAKYLENSQVHPLLVETGKMILKLDIDDIKIPSVLGNPNEANNTTVGTLANDVKAEIQNLEQKVNENISNAVVESIKEEINITK